MMRLGVRGPNFHLRTLEQISWYSLSPEYPIGFSVPEHNIALGIKMWLFLFLSLGSGLLTSGGKEMWTRWGASPKDAWGVHSTCRRQKLCQRKGAQFSCSVVSDSLWPHGLQRTRPPCPSPTPRVYSKSCPLCRGIKPISSSVVPFSSCLQSFPASGSFPMSQFFVSGGQSIGVSASASVLPMNIQDWFPLGWTGWISLAVQGTLKSLLQHHSSKAPIL